MQKELKFLRITTLVLVIGMVFLTSATLHQHGKQKFSEIDVERINIVEKDGTVKMVITNVDRFPNGDEKVNERALNEKRKKRAGMLFFNEDGVECGGFIYDGQKKENTHSSGLSLTFDQYDGDQVMQLLTQDYMRDNERQVYSALAFNDRPAKETQQRTREIMKELEELGKTDDDARKQKYAQYLKEGLLGGVPRVMLGKSRNENNGLFLFDDRGNPKAMFFVDKDNHARLDFYDDSGTVIASFPEQKVK